MQYLHVPTLSSCIPCGSMRRGQRREQLPAATRVCTSSKPVLRYRRGANILMRCPGSPGKDEVQVALLVLIGVNRLGPAPIADWP